MCWYSKTREAACRKKKGDAGRGGCSKETMPARLPSRCGQSQRVAADIGTSCTNICSFSEVSYLPKPYCIHEADGVVKNLRWGKIIFDVDAPLHAVRGVVPRNRQLLETLYVSNLRLSSSFFFFFTSGHETFVQIHTSVSQDVKIA